eukprot:Selendium_serpulae@DN6261_c3_g1_i7.p2
MTCFRLTDTQGGCYRCNHSGTTEGVDLDTCECLHAEINAIIGAGSDRCRDATLYVTCFPCMSCAKSVAQSGIKTVVYGREYGGPNAQAKEYLQRQGLELRAFITVHKEAHLQDLQMFFPLSSEAERKENEKTQISRLESRLANI